jgi:hypothetical protein
MFTPQIRGQYIYKFSTKTDKFPSELYEFMSTNLDKSRKKDLKVFIAEFRNFWMSDTLSEMQKKAVIKITNKMSIKRMRPFPNYEIYIKTIMNLSRNQVALGMFDKWMKTLTPLLKSKSSTNYVRYLQKSTELFEHNYIYSSNAVIWKVSNLDFEISVNGTMPVFTFNTIDISCKTRRDSSIIFQTQGKLDIIKGKWILRCAFFNNY